MKTGGLCCSKYKRFINFCLWFFDTRRETQFLKVFHNNTMLTLSQCTVHLVVFKIFVGRDPKILTATAMVENSILYAPITENSTICLHGPMSTFNWLFFKIHKFLRTISSRHDVIHTPAPFPVWGFIMTMVIVISFVHKRKEPQLTELLTQIVRSSTKLNDKI